MKTLWIVNFVLITALSSLLYSNTAQADQYNSNFQLSLNAAYDHPKQLHAATQWRLKNRHLNLRNNRKFIQRFGWHPSVVAVIFHPQFFNYAYNQRSFNQFPQQKVFLNRGRNSAFVNNRSFNRGFNRGFSRGRRSTRGAYCPY